MFLFARKEGRRKEGMIKEGRKKGHGWKEGRKEEVRKEIRKDMDGRNTEGRHWKEARRKEREHGMKELSIIVRLIQSFFHQS